MRRAHAHDHRLAIEGFKALLEVATMSWGDEFQSLPAPTMGFELRPSGLEFLLARDLLTLGGFLKLRVDGRPLALVEGELGQAAFVVDRHRRFILDRALDVVDADVVTEYGAGIGVPKLDRRSGESNKGSIGQGIAHVASIAVDKVVLAAMGFVSNDHDVTALGKRRVGIALLLGKELLDGW